MAEFLTSKKLAEFFTSWPNNSLKNIEFITWVDDYWVGEESKPSMEQLLYNTRFKHSVESKNFLVVIIGMEEKVRENLLNLEKNLSKWRWGYDLQLMSNDISIKPNNLYIEYAKKDTILKYTVITPEDKQITATISAEDLKDERLWKELCKVDPKSLLKVLNLHLEDISRVTSKKGHTRWSTDLRKVFKRVLSSSPLILQPYSITDENGKHYRFKYKENEKEVAIFPENKKVFEVTPEGHLNEIKSFTAQQPPKKDNDGRCVIM